MNPEFDIIILSRYQEKLFQLDMEMCSLNSIAKRVISRKSDVSPKAILYEGLRLLYEIDVMCNDFYIQYLKVNN